MSPEAVISLSLLLLASVSGDSEAEAQVGGSGEQYLKRTEDRWDGKTAWFTGSSCDCNGWATRCQFNEELYRQTGNGVQCLQCGGNRDGAHCEKCKADYYLAPGSASLDYLDTSSLTRGPACVPCECHPEGSEAGQCEAGSGQCPCRPGLTGLRCDACAEQSWNFPLCRPCACLPAGTLGGAGACGEAGSCQCKQFVTGDNCDQCVQGYFEIDADNVFGCSPCFCHGHTDKCKVATGFVKTSLRSHFTRGLDGWAAEEEGKNIQDRTIFNAYKKIIGVQSMEAPAFFLAPKNFLRNQLASYGQLLKFKLKLGPLNGRRVEPSDEDIILEGGDGATVAISVTAQGNPRPDESFQSFQFRLHEHRSLGWRPELTSAQFMQILNNLTAIRIRGTYFSPGEGFIDAVELETALPGTGGEPAKWIEQCECPVGYKGQHCETCEPGYFHDQATGKCVPCNCHGHSDYCQVDTGVCDCTHNTVGHTCDTCADGYYGDARAATPDDCQPCPCPQVAQDGGSSRLGRCYLSGSSVTCSECPAGRTGARCERCVDGYYGDPEGLSGPPRPCVQCQCNGNIDLGSSGNCDPVTGACLKCISNTAGERCELCRPGFWGDAVTRGVGCVSCQCYKPGTGEKGECDAKTGQCVCRSNVEGERCDRCRDTYWNIDSGSGCDPCNCDPIGSLHQSCDLRTGRCECRPGISGHRCDVCMANHYGFSPSGCRTCDCDSRGSAGVACDQLTGQCRCAGGEVEGRRCDRCRENTRARPGPGQPHCQPCPVCYNLVQAEVDKHRLHLAQLDSLLQQIAENPQPVGEHFEQRLMDLEAKIKLTLDAANNLRDGTDAVGLDARASLESMIAGLERTRSLGEDSENNLMRGEQLHRDASKQAKKALRTISTIKGSLVGVELRLMGECKRALADAEERSRKLGEGSEKMTDIASKARRLSEKQQMDATEIDQMAQEAINLSNQADKLANEGLEEQAKTTGQIQSVLNIVSDLSERLATIENLGFEALENSQTIYNDALSIYRKIYNLDSPNVETKYLTDKALSLSRDADRLKTDASTILAENEQLLVETRNNRENLSKLLNRALSQQKEVDDRLQDMKEHRAQGKEAIDVADDILSKARATLDILKDFENRVDNNREAARAAMKKSNELEETIRQAVTKTSKASEFLRDTDNDSHTAFSMAEESSVLAKKTSDKAKLVSTESSKTRESTQSLLKEAKSDKNKVMSFFKILDGKDKIAARDAQTASESLTEANKAQSSADMAALKVREAKMELDAILDIIAVVEEPEPGILDDLERRLDAAERKYENAGIEARLASLHEERKKQMMLLIENREEMEVLTNEFRSLEEISNSLPNQCWNKIRLEP